MDNLGIITATLGLKDGVDEKDIREAILKLQDEAGQVATLRSKIEELEGKLGEQQKAKSKDLIDAAIKDGRLREEQRESFVALFDQDFENTKTVLEAMNPVQKLSDIGSQTNEAAKKITYKGKTFAELRQEDPAALKELKDRDPQTFRELFKSQYKKDYQG